MKKKLIYIFVLFMAIGAILGIVCHNKLNKFKYALDLPASDSLSSIRLEQNRKDVEIKESETIKDIVYVINGVKRTTSKQSIQDSPVNVENKIKVDFNFKEEGTSTIFVYEKNEKYYIEQPYNGIYRISADEYNSIEKYLRENGNNTSSYIPKGMDIADENDIGNTANTANTQEFYRSPENVTIEVLKDTISSKGVSIRIKDNKEDSYGWGVEFRVQKKVNGEWKDLEYLSSDLSWIDIAYELGEDKQLDLKLDIEKYYGELLTGTYRIVKPVYDKEYIDIYSDEFEIT